MDNNIDTAYLEFINYANEKIQQARWCTIQFSNNENFLKIQKEQLKLLLSMFN